MRPQLQGAAGSLRRVLSTAMAITMTSLSVQSAPADAVEVLNKGIGGHSSRDGLRRFDRDVAALSPDHLLIYFGINDALNSAKLVPVEEFRANLQDMIDRASRNGVKTVVLTTPNPIVASYVKQRHPKHPETDLDKHLDAYDRAVRELAAANDVLLADLRKTVRDHCADVESGDSLIRNIANSRTRDGVHLTPEGYRIMAELYAGLLAGHVKPGDRIVCFGDSITYGAHMTGAGTSFGQTYPAWLGILVNRSVGNPVGDVPLPPPPEEPQRPARPSAPLPPSPHTLRNDSIALSFFRPEDGGGIAGIRNPEGWEFIQARPRTSLWTITLRRIPGDDDRHPETVKLSLDPEQDDSGAARDDKGDNPEIIEIAAADARATCSVNKIRDGIELTWRGMDVGSEKGVLDVTVTCALKPEDPFVRFRTDFENRSRVFTVFSIASPRVDGIAGPASSREEDCLATPCYTGRLIRNPSANGILGKPRRYQPNRSGHSMQFDAYYHDGHGLYLGCFDGDQMLKRYVLEADPEHGIGWATVHVPDTMKSVPQQWTVPYDTVLRTFDGDWYDAARIYRQWALRQTWTAEGPMHSRSSTPDWFKNLDEWMMWNFEKGAGGIVYDPLVEEVLEDCTIGHYASNYGTGTHQLINSPDRFPLKPSDNDFIEQSTRHNRPIMAYIQAICWDTQSPSYLRLEGDRHTVRNFYGQRVVWDFTGRSDIGVLCAIAWPGDAWTQALGDTVVKMAEAGMRAAYLDSNNHAGTYMNFNPLYTDDSGGGNAYIKANQTMMADIKKRARAVDPGFCFSAESFWEGNMAQLDAYLTCNTTNQFLDDTRVTAIPLAHAVYHDYTIMYSAWVGRHDLQEQDGQGYVAKFAQTFVWGVKNGWNQPTFMLTFRNKDIATEFNRHRYRAYRAAKPFLVYGEMLRPPELVAPTEPLRFKWYRGWSKSSFDTAMPPVLASLWKAPDGRIALVAYNISDTDTTAVLKCRLPGPGTPTELSVIYQPQNQSPPTAAAKDDGTTEITCTLPARTPLVCSISTKR